MTREHDGTADSARSHEPAPSEVPDDVKEAFRTELMRRPGALEEFRRAVLDERSRSGTSPAPSRYEVAGRLAGEGNRFQAAMRRNHYEEEQMRVVLMAALRSGSNAIDIGAAGGDVLREIQRVAPDGLHIAFEPRPDAASRLAGLFPGVDVRATALSDTNGAATFVCVKNALPFSGLARHSYPAYVDDSEIEEITVPVARLDDCIEPDYAPALIKIDVEGAERQLLEGASRTLTAHRPVLVFEHIFSTAAVHGTTSEAVHQLLCDELGYRIFDLAGDGPYSLDEFEESQLQSRWINYVACP